MTSCARYIKFLKQESKANLKKQKTTLKVKPRLYPEEEAQQKAN